MDFMSLTAEPFTSDDAVHALVHAVESGTLPRAAWNHRAHLAVGLVIARRIAPANGFRATRDAILQYNAAAGIKNTTDSGYHETLTSAYVHLIAVHVAEHPVPSSLASDVNSLVETYGARGALFEYFSRSRLLSREARATVVPPDLKPLPLPSQPVLHERRIPSASDDTFRLRS
jgi:hypothetical protein